MHGYMDTRVGMYECTDMCAQVCKHASGTCLGEGMCEYVVCVYTYVCVHGYKGALCTNVCTRMHMCMHIYIHAFTDS